MTDVLHKDLTGADLHEPKGVSTASTGQVYIADGAGSGDWTSLAFPDGTFTVSTSVYTSSTTWTKPSNLFIAKITVVGGGGGTSGTGGTSSFGSIISVSGGGVKTAVGTIITGGQFYAPGGAGQLTVGGYAHGNSYYGRGANGPVRAFVDGDHPDFGSVYGGNGTDVCGGGGGYAHGWYTESSLPSSAAVTVGTGGSGGPGNPGVVIVEHFIKATS
jgi:hypothetical protein